MPAPVKADEETRFSGVVQCFAGALFDDSVYPVYLMFALVVSLRVKPDMRDRFLAAAQDDSTFSVRDEPGCLRFDVLQDNADPDHFFFYEVYRDEAAFQAHTQAPHFAKWREAAAEVLAAPTEATRTTTLFPRDYK
jgi:autoinducer 2-degrading protein